jgi:hypothetical protein
MVADVLAGLVADGLQFTDGAACMPVRGALGLAATSKETESSLAAATKKIASPREQS